MDVATLRRLVATHRAWCQHRPSHKRTRARVREVDGLALSKAEAQLLGLASRQPWLLDALDRPSGSAPGSAPAGTPRKIRTESKDAEDREVTTTSDWPQSLPDLLRFAEVDLDEWRVSKWIANAWGNPDNANNQVKAWLERRPSAHVYPVAQSIQIGPPPTPSPVDGVETAVFLPDSQIGYSRHLDTGALTPFHDRAAIHAAIQLVAEIQPQRIVLLGDNLDCTGFSTHRVKPQWRYTQQPALVEMHWLLATLRRAAPAAAVLWAFGNHEYRIERQLNDVIDEAAELRQIGSDTPAMSLRHLLRLDDLGVEASPYGDRQWLWSDLAIEHGQQHSPSALSSCLASSPHSRAWGHIHRRWVGWRTVQTPDGPREISVFCPGTLCHTDGRVPGARKGQQDWQQGVAVAHRTDDGTHVQVLPITRGSLHWGGRRYVGDDYTDTLREATGWERY